MKINLSVEKKQGLILEVLHFLNKYFQEKIEGLKFSLDSDGYTLGEQHPLEDHKGLTLVFSLEPKGIEGSCIDFFLTFDRDRPSEAGVLTHILLILPEVKIALVEDCTTIYEMCVLLDINSQGIGYK